MGVIRKAEGPAYDALVRRAVTAEEALAECTKKKGKKVDTSALEGQIGDLKDVLNGKDTKILDLQEIVDGKDHEIINLNEIVASAQEEIGKLRKLTGAVDLGEETPCEVTEEAQAEADGIGAPDVTVP